MEDKLLAAEGEELRRLLGEILQPESLYYLWADTEKKWPKFDPLPIDDWDVAMKWRDWAVKEYGQMNYGPALAKVSGVKDDYSLAFWLMTDAQPEHYLKAAALCKLEGE